MLCFPMTRSDRDGLEVTGGVYEEGKEGETHCRETEMRAQRPDDVLREVRLVRVPDEADGDDLGGVHEDPSDPDPLPTVALEKEKEKKTKQKSGHKFTSRALDITEPGQCE